MEKRDSFVTASRNARERLASQPRALSVRYDRRARKIVIGLSNRVDIAFSPDDAQGLEHATAADLTLIQISPSGLGLHFPRLDADIYIPGLLEGALGSRKWMASRLGQRGGRVRSEAKATAARKNGQLGGRPRKKAVA